MRVLYFAWLRTAIGVGEEDIRWPQEGQTIAHLLDHLAQRSPRHADAFADRSAIRAAINHDHAELDSVIVERDEVALFPPVTGG